MPNIDRQFEKNCFYHIYNRGNRKQPVFLDDFDHQYFLRLIIQNSIKFRVELIANCLMRNHYHFLVHQVADHSESISKCIGNSTMSYTHYFNRKYTGCGSLFERPFKSTKVVSDEQLYYLSWYIHKNPSSFADPLQYKWSSLAEYTAGSSSVLKMCYIQRYLNGRPYLSKEVSLLSG
jgi:putative transposase